jgi:phosphoglucomutase
MIKFGTSGWRAVMGDEFTFQNVRIVVQATVNWLKKRFPDQPCSIVVNYDTRFLSEHYALEAAKLLSKNQIRVFLADRDAPSQAQSYQIIKRQCQGGINFTASFNPPEYNGLKFNTHTGAPALPEVTDRIEEEIQKLAKDFSPDPYYARTEFITRIDLRSDYLEFLQKKIDFEVIRRSGIKVGLDLLFGTSREYLDEILEENEIPIEEIHGYVDPYFGGVIPSCTEENLRELKRLVKDKKCNLGLATDADGDRFGILDQNGGFIHQNFILAMLLDYLVSVKGWRGGVARSVTTTHLIDRIARKYDLPVYRTPVGFKYIAELFLQGKIIFGGEESACIAVKDHLPEKDGIFAGLLVTEMVAALGKSLSEIKQNLFKDYGQMVGGQKNIPRTPEAEKKLKEFISDPPSRLGNRKIEATEAIDGIKLDFANDTWLLLRFSGTEPLIRCYAEAETKKELDQLMKLGLEIFP